MKTIGVLGGLGPQATMDFEVRIASSSGGSRPA
jgi:aspartate/glutamate racemase